MSDELCVMCGVVCVCARAHARAYVRACVRVCACVFVCVCVHCTPVPPARRRPDRDVLEGTKKTLLSDLDALSTATRPVIRRT